MAGLRLRIAFAAIKKHERNTFTVVIAASSALCQRNKSMDGPDVIPWAIPGPHGVSARNFVIEHILGINRARLSTGPGLREALFAIKVHERDTFAVLVTSVSTLC